ncbi:MAG: YihA family ribosome biogenesis GTP-binding protein [Leptospiraceae bacterium]|nr:YihA family ribosome biogenesis GTP-binding protein [Leptospiraceae bacterium]MCP5512289.1 YihA family ribosome biogenesis GTP-binding protein [Leptospiraceae bacterium]
MNDSWIETVEYHSSHHNFKKIPQNSTMPQIAFCGRSNSGKSSLINAILGKKELVHVSSTPGKTRSLNFFLLNKKIFLVDLPGFGYAKASHSVRDYLEEVVNGYLNHVDTLRILFILCDAKRPFPEEEKNLIPVCLKRNILPVVVRTKIDKLNQKEKEKVKKESLSLIKEHPGLACIHTSSKNRDGIQDIRDLLKEF